MIREIKDFLEVSDYYEDISRIVNRPELEKDLAYNEMENDFIASLSREQRKEYEDIMHLNYTINDQFIAEAFRQGYKLGTLILLDCLKED